jgi:hypothetical protein
MVLEVSCVYNEFDGKWINFSNTPPSQQGPRWWGTLHDQTKKQFQLRMVIQTTSKKKCFLLKFDILERNNNNQI